MDHVTMPARSPGTPSYFFGPKAFVLHYMGSRLDLVVALLVLALSAASAAIGVQYALKLLVDTIAGPSDIHDRVWLVLLLFVALIATESLCWRGVGWFACRTTVQAGVKMRLDLFNFLNRQPMRYFADNLAGSLGQRITGTAGNFGAFVNTLVWRLLPPCVDFVGALVIFSTVDVGMAVALAIVVSGVTGLLLWFGERGRGLHRDYSGRASSIAGELIDTITNMWAVKAFTARQRESERLSDGFQAEARAQQTSWMHIEKARLLHDVTLCLAAGGMLAWAISLWEAGRITPGDVVVVTGLTFRILHSSRDFALSVVDWGQQFGFIDETLRMVAQPQTVLDEPDAPELKLRGGTLEFRDVRFSYPGARSGLHGITVTIPAGQKVGIVGPSGAGKSTFVQLLQRLYDVQHGTVLIDDQPIAGITQVSLRRALAVVPQEIALFHRSVIDNIRFGRPEATDEEVYAASRAAHCDGFIRALPEGYHTIVGERGTKLSGGQRQRIGIARALLKRAPIIVFDEATSALDTESEIQVQRALVRLMQGRTVIAVAHRLSTLAEFDRVLVLHEGRIVEDGSPSQLSRSGGIYAGMLALQADGLKGDVLGAAA
jgi:ATP-binding cassette subfamily B protein